MKALKITEELYQYTVDNCFEPHPILKKIQNDTKDRPDAVMQIPADQGAFMAMLLKSMNAKVAIEIGCYTGYSTISIASSLPTGGMLYSLDINDEAIKTAKSYAEEAGLNEKINFMKGPALNSLETLVTELSPNSIDFAFIDADKGNQTNYYEVLLNLIKPNGIIIADNVLWYGRVVDPEALAKDNDTKAMIAFNQHVQSDSRVEATMLHISDGLYLIRKK